MEKIRVNMTPIEEVKTIHASQGDNATRKWAFDLYDENGKIDSSSIKEQMIFDSRVGGMEQILPENTSNPTTSPIIADIQYPDSLRSEQTFLYRESPTQEDGQAKITHIKGNTVVFNQLIKNGNFGYYGDWSYTACTYTTSNNVATITSTNNWGRIRTVHEPFIVGHKYYYSYEAKINTLGDALRLYTGNAFGDVRRDLSSTTTDWQKLVGIVECTNATGNAPDITNATNGIYTWQQRRCMLFDLTAMGLDGLTLAEAEQWFSNYFPLSYYDYTTGKLLPFKGESLKTTGKNLIDVPQNVTLNGQGRFVAQNTPVNLKSGNYRLSFTCSERTGTNVQFQLILKDSGNNNIVTPSKNMNPGENYIDFVLPRPASIMEIYTNNQATAIYDKIIIQYSSNSDYAYEPYTTDTLSLPVNDYFPTGMKDCSQSSQVFDEKTESKAITRVKHQLMNGTETWERVNTLTNCYQFATVPTSPTPAKTSGMKANIQCDKFIPSTGDYVYLNDTEGINVDTSGKIRITILKSKLSGNTGTDMANWVSNNNFNVYYELATPTEESITTASLVTEKGETPLYYDDELIADCNETISSESGIFDAKIKLMTDDTIYSQKIQLHIEKAPN